MCITGSSYSEVIVSVGRVKGPYIRARSVLIIGVVVIPLIVADEEVIVTGSGRVGVLASETCVLAYKQETSYS
jgi:cytoskeletal protein CcmA (bactofilin family)